MPRPTDASATAPTTPAGPGSFTVLVMSPTDTQAFVVPTGGRVVVGRGTECDVRIDDSRLSRRHAELRADGELHFVDLGSRNGSFLRHGPIKPNEPVAVAVGESIALGDSVLVVAERPPADDARARLAWTGGDFALRLAAECARAANGDAPFAIVRLRVTGTNPTATTISFPVRAIAVLLEAASFVANSVPNEYDVLLTATSPEQADARAAEVTAALRRAALDFVIGVAAYPRDGRTAAALLAHAGQSFAEPPEAHDDGARATALDRLEPAVDRVAESTINVLVLGETGVGKEVLARRIHARSPRRHAPLVSINCAALSESLLENELFGHEKGAFTGALVAKPGLLESADGGTIFLDEIGELSPLLQGKLLRVLDHHEVTRLGAIRPTQIDVRFIAATNRNLTRDVAEGRFRQDLYFRLKGVLYRVPPLRERIDEIEPLASAFAADAARESRRPTASLAPSALALLRAYRWPGNVRELRHAVARATLACSGNVILPEHFELETTPPRSETPSAPPPADVAPDAERKRVLDTLAACGGNQRETAKRLGMSRGTLAKRIAAYGAARPRKGTSGT